MYWCIHDIDVHFVLICVRSCLIPMAHFSALLPRCTTVPKKAEFRPILRLLWISRWSLYCPYVAEISVQTVCPIWMKMSFTYLRQIDGGFTGVYEAFYSKFSTYISWILSEETGNPLRCHVSVCKSCDIRRNMSWSHDVSSPKEGHLNFVPTTVKPHVIFKRRLRPQNNIYVWKLWPFLLPMEHVITSLKQNIYPKTYITVIINR